MKQVVLSPHELLTNPRKQCRYLITRTLCNALKLSLFATLSLYFSTITLSEEGYPKNYSQQGPGIPPYILKKCIPTKGFDFPVGKPHAHGYYNAQKFTRNNHLGDDWNGRGGGNTDLHDPIYSIGNGIVTYAQMEGLNWGRVVRIIHNRGTRKKPIFVESIYAHMRKIMVKPGMTVKRGQQIGTIGNAGGVYYAHLHLEIRNIINKPIGTGYSANTTGYVDPTKFIRSFRPPRPTKELLAKKREAKKKKAKLRFRKSLISAASSQIDHSVIYDGRYQKIDYPSGDIMSSRGNAADLIIRIFRQVKIDLQKEVHLDIKDNFNDYPQKWGLTKADSNIDHRRIENLKVFFERKSNVLKLSKLASDYHAGDIVTWKLDNGLNHIGIIVDKKSNDQTRPLIVHNIGVGPEIEDILFEYEITGHFRYPNKQKN